MRMETVYRRTEPGDPMPCGRRGCGPWFHAVNAQHNICGGCKLHEVREAGGWSYYKPEHCPVCKEKKRGD